MTNGNIDQPKPLRWGCVLHQCKDGLWLVRNASRTHWWDSFDEMWKGETEHFIYGWASTREEAAKDFSNCQTPPPDWTEPEQLEQFDEFTGPPTTDPASCAIAAHTTPGQSTDITPTMPEMIEIADATCMDFQRLKLALTRYGLRAYKAGQDHVLNQLKGPNR